MKKKNSSIQSKWNSCYRARRAHTAAARDTAHRAPVPLLPKAPDRACDSQGEQKQIRIPPKIEIELATRHLAVGILRARAHPLAGRVLAPSRAAVRRGAHRAVDDGRGRDAEKNDPQRQKDPNDSATLPKGTPITGDFGVMSTF